MNLKKESLFVVLGILFLFGFLSLSPAELPFEPSVISSEQKVNLLTGQVTFDEQYSSPSPSFIISPNKIIFEEEDDSVGVEVSTKDTIIYKYGYFSTVDSNKWTQFELRGEDDTDWIYSEAEGSFRLDANDFANINSFNDENYVILYSCTRKNFGWDCHDDKWQLKSFSLKSDFCTCTINGRCTDEGDIIDNKLCTDDGVVDLPDDPSDVPEDDDDSDNEYRVVIDNILIGEPLNYGGDDIILPYFLDETISTAGQTIGVKELIDLHDRIYFYGVDENGNPFEEEFGKDIRMVTGFTAIEYELTLSNFDASLVTENNPLVIPIAGKEITITKFTNDEIVVDGGSYGDGESPIFLGEPSDEDEADWVMSVGYTSSSKVGKLLFKLNQRYEEHEADEDDERSALYEDECISLPLDYAHVCHGGLQYSQSDYATMNVEIDEFDIADVNDAWGYIVTLRGGSFTNAAGQTFDKVWIVSDGVDTTTYARIGSNEVLIDEEFYYSGNKDLAIAGGTSDSQALVLSMIFALSQTNAEHVLLQATYPNVYFGPTAGADSLDLGYNRLSNGVWAGFNSIGNLDPDSNYFAMNYGSYFESPENQFNKANNFEISIPKKQQTASIVIRNGDIDGGFDDDSDDNSDDNSSEESILINKHYLSPSNTVQVGKSLLAYAEIENNGDTIITDIVLEVRVPELGISDTERMSELSPGDVGVFDAALLRFPLDTEADTYLVEYVVTFNQYEVIRKSVVTVTGQPVGVDLTGECQYTISQPGSYYLSGDMGRVGCSQNGPTLTVEADNVDLHCNDNIVHSSSYNALYVVDAENFQAFDCHFSSSYTKKNYKSTVLIKDMVNSKLYGGSIINKGNYIGLIFERGGTVTDNRFNDISMQTGLSYAVLVAQSTTFNDNTFYNVDMKKINSNSRLPFHFDFVRNQESNELIWANDGSELILNPTELGSFETAQVVLDENIIIDEQSVTIGGFDSYLKSHDRLTFVIDSHSSNTVLVDGAVCTYCTIIDGDDDDVTTFVIDQDGARYVSIDGTYTLK